MNRVNRQVPLHYSHIGLVYKHIETDYIDKKDVKSRNDYDEFFFFVFTAWFLFPVRVEALLLMLKLMLFFRFMSRESALSTSDPGPPYFLISKRVWNSGCLERFDDRITTTWSNWSPCDVSFEDWSEFYN